MESTHPVFNGRSVCFVDLYFNFAPLFGWSMAFVNYKPRFGIFGSEWVGLKYFTEFLSDKRFFEVLRNTIAMSGLNIVFGTACAILLAVFLSEINSRPFKRTVQTLTYLPHFISWVVVSNIFYTFSLPKAFSTIF